METWKRGGVAERGEKEGAQTFIIFRNGRKEEKKLAACQTTEINTRQGCPRVLGTWSWGRREKERHVTLKASRARSDVWLALQVQYGHEEDRQLDQFHSTVALFHLQPTLPSFLLLAHSCFSNTSSCPPASFSKQTKILWIIDSHLQPSYPPMEKAQKNCLLSGVSQV